MAKLIEEGKQPVETDGRTIEGSKIESSHGISSLVERHADGPPEGRTGDLRSPGWGLRNPYLGSHFAARKGAGTH
jgi:hypothetical protein